MSLCALRMKAEGFDHYRCDKNISLGVNTPNLSKILKCAGKSSGINIIYYIVFQCITYATDALLIEDFFPIFSMPLLSDQLTGNEDLVTIKSEEETDTLNMMFESPNQVHFMHTLLFFASSILLQATSSSMMQFLHFSMKN